MVSQVSSGRLETEAATKTRAISTGQIFFKHLKIFSGDGAQVMIVSNQALRLQLVNQCINFFQMPVYRRFIGFIMIIRQAGPSNHQTRHRQSVHIG